VYINYRNFISWYVSVGPRFGGGREYPSEHRVCWQYLLYSVVSICSLAIFDSIFLFNMWAVWIMDIIVLECRWFDGMVLPHYCTVHSNLLLLSSNPGINMGKCTYISAHWHSFILYYYWFDRLAFEYVVQFESYKVLEKITLQIIVHVLFNLINIPGIIVHLFFFRFLCLRLTPAGSPPQS
jgi:hypothetical protein